MEKKKTVWERVVVGFLVLVGALGLGLFTLLILVMFNECVECWAKGVLGVGRKKDTIQFIALGIAGVLAIFGAVAVSRRAVAQIQIAEAEARNNELTEKGNIQERFKAAAEHLGSKHEWARIASFYEFYHLARDNDNLQESIFDMLCAHLRQITISDEYKPRTKINPDEKDFKSARPTEEIQSLLDVLFQPKSSQRGSVFAEFQQICGEFFW